MNKKSLNVIEAIIQVIALFMLWGNGMYMATANSKLFSNTEPDISLSFMQATSGYDVIKILIIALFVANIIICAVSAYKDENERDSMLHAILPVVNLVSIFALGQMLLGNVINDSAVYAQKIVLSKVGSLFTVMFVVLLVIVILALVKRSRSVISREE